MSEIFGEFTEQFDELHEGLELSFTLGSRSIEERWRNNRLSAYFVADYLANFLLNDEQDEVLEERREDIKNNVSYVGNELLENAIKFHEGGEYPVKFGIHFLENLESSVVIFTKNRMKHENVEKFQYFIKELLAADPKELYVQQVEKAAESEDGEASGLGLLSAIDDYSAKLGWKFESDRSNPQIVTVTTMARIVV